MYRAERKLFALIGIIIVAASLVLIQITAARKGNDGPIIKAGSSLVALVENVTATLIAGVREAGTTILMIPHLESDNSSLRTANEQLEVQNARLYELVAAYQQEIAMRPVVDRFTDGIEARVIGFPPEDEARTVTIDRGSRDGVTRDDGVVASSGVVGRIQDVGPFSSTVVLLTDYTSRIPAIVRTGRWWGIARGNLTSVRLEYISQDATLRVGNVVVTGNGRSFASGIPIGTIVEIDRNDAALYQTAVLKPAVDLGALDRVVVLPK